MAYAANVTPIYAREPLDLVPVAVPATAKTVFTDITNAVQIANNVNGSQRKQVFQKVFIQPTANLTAGRMMLFKYNGTTAFLAKDVAHGSISVTTTAEGAEIDFGFTDADPLILEEGWSAYVGSAVAQAAGSAIVNGRGKLF